MTSVSVWAEPVRGGSAPGGPQVVAHRALQAAVEDVRARFGDDDAVELPPFWGGYRVVPDELELWQHWEDRLHDRIEYRRTPDGVWAISRLQP